MRLDSVGSFKIRAMGDEDPWPFYFRAIGIFSVAFFYSSLDELGMKGAPSVMVQGVVDLVESSLRPAGILPKFHNADRWEFRGNVSRC